jgi:hypothetical protein
MVCLKNLKLVSLCTIKPRPPERHTNKNDKIFTAEFEIFRSNLIHPSFSIRDLCHDLNINTSHFSLPVPCRYVCVVVMATVY